MGKKRKIAKELKRPDQFVDFWTRAWLRVAAVVGPRRKPALAVLVALAVAATGVAIIERWEGGRTESASDELARIERMAAAEVIPGEHPEIKDGIPRFKTAAERRDAVLRDLDSFIKGRSGSRLHGEALLMKGAELLAGARYDEAIAAYQAALAAKLDPRLAFLAHEGLGYAHEGKRDWDRALAAFSALGADAAVAEGFYQDRALYQKARITERKGDRASAAKLYAEILKKVPDTTLKGQITDRLALLEVE